MAPTLDVAAALFLVIGVVLLAAWYGARVLVEGEVRSPRVARAGTSPFLGRTPMEAAYASFEPIGTALARLGITANAITASGVVPSLFAGVAAAYGMLGLAAALAAVGAMADALDGVVARATTGPTRAGALYDSYADRYVEFLLLGGLAVHFRASLPALLVVLGALAGAFMVSFVSAKSEAAAIVVPRGWMRRAERAVYLVLGCMLAPLVGRLAPDVAWVYDAPVLVACGLIAIFANASAGLRLAALARAVDVAPARPVEPRAAILAERLAPRVVDAALAASRSSEPRCVH